MPVSIVAAASHAAFVRPGRGRDEIPQLQKKEKRRDKACLCLRAGIA